VAEAARAIHHAHERGVLHRSCPPAPPAGMRPTRCAHCPAKSSPESARWTTFCRGAPRKTARRVHPEPATPLRYQANETDPER
jgi:hypothetical protein